LNFDNGHRQRQGQHNKRGRGRNNRRPGGGGSGGQHGGGNSINRVYESNGPDVKVRGTAQTIAEKYMQLGRDAHSSGDNVMAESYYQFAEHYFRVLQSAQPPGQTVSQILRRPGEEPEEEVEVAEGDDGASSPEGVADGGEAPAAGAEGEAASAGEGGQAAPQGDRRDFRPRGEEGREGRDRFRPRWQQRRDSRDRGPDSQPRDPHASAEGGEAGYNAPQADDAGEQGGNWEAPSFLKRPVPVVDATPGAEDAERRPPRSRRSRPTGEGSPPEPAADEE